MVSELSKEKEQTPHADPDAGLVARAKAGDLDAFEQLVNRHQKKMLNIAWRLINDYDDACEAVQDAFVAAYRNLGSFRNEARFSTWITSITLNQSRNKRKQVLSHQARQAYSLNDPMTTDDGEMNRDTPSKDQSALDRLEEREVQTRVRDCMNGLERDFREVLVLRDMQELSYEEIGSVLKLAGGTVKSRLFRAREQVKDCLKKFLGEL